MDRQDAMKVLDFYLYDYLIKHNFVQTAEAFAIEDELTVMPVGADLPEGFLYEWWSIFWDIYCSHTNIGNPSNSNSYVGLPGNLPQIINNLVPMSDGNLLQNVIPSIPMSDGNVLMQAVDSLIDIPGPSNRPNPIGLPMMPAPDTGNVWRSTTEMMSGLGFDLELSAVAGLNMVPMPTSMDDVITAAFHMEELLRSPIVNLNSEMQLSLNAPVRDPPGRISHWPMEVNNYWPLSAGMDGNAGSSWVASTSSEMPTLLPHLLPNYDVGAPRPALHLPPPVLQPSPNRQGPEETGSSASSNSPPTSNSKC